MRWQDDGLVCHCHPEQASFAPQGIWAGRAKLRRFVGLNEVEARSRNPERSEGSNRVFGSLPYQTAPLPVADWA